jgi:hypothetical protein
MTADLLKSAPVLTIHLPSRQRKFLAIAFIFCNFDMSAAIETYFTVTVNGYPKYLPVIGTTITTSATTTPRTWVKLTVNGRLLEAFLIDQSYEEALSRWQLARGK